MKSLVSATCFIICFRYTSTTEYSCEEFQKVFYTAEYREKCYTYRKTYESWPSAKDICESDGGHLPRPTDSAQHDFVLNVTNYILRGGQKHEKGKMLSWTDAKRINGQLHWSNGGPITFSKPIYNKDDAENCILASLDMWQLSNCDSWTSLFICEHDKLPKQYKTTTELTTPAESTTIVTESPFEGVSVQPEKVKVQREMNFRDVRHLNGILNPRLNMEAYQTIFTDSLTECAGRCFYMNQVCHLFNFYSKTGECRIHLVAKAALQGGAETAAGWKLYQRY